MPSQPTPTTLHIRVDEFGQEYDASGRLLHEITSGRTGMDRTRCRSVLQSAAEAGVMGPGVRSVAAPTGPRLTPRSPLTSPKRSAWPRAADSCSVITR